MKWLMLICLIVAPTVYASVPVQYVLNVQFFDANGTALAAGTIFPNNTKGVWSYGNNKGYPELVCGASNGLNTRTFKSIMLFSGIKTTHKTDDGKMLFTMSFFSVKSDAAKIAKIPASQCVNEKPTQLVHVETAVFNLSDTTPHQIQLKNGDVLKYQISRLNS